MSDVPTYIYITFLNIFTKNIGEIIMAKKVGMVYNFLGNKVIGVGDGTAANDVVNKSQLDAVQALLASYIAKDGSTSTTAQIPFASGLSSAATISITSTATTGQPNFLNLTNSVSDAITMYYNEDATNFAADTWQLRIGGTTGRPFHITRFNTFSYISFGAIGGTTAATATVNIPLTTPGSVGGGALVVGGGASFGGALFGTSATLSGGLSVAGSSVSMANIPSGTIATGGNLGLDASGNVVKATVSGGGGGTTILSGTISVGTTSWSGNTNYPYSVTVTGAAVGDCVVFTIDAANYATINQAGVNFMMWGTVTAANTVQVNCRVSTYVSLTSASIAVRVIK